MATTRFRLFAGVAPGLEHLLSAELTEIVRGVSWKSVEGGAEALVSREELWAVAHKSRVAELLRVRIGEFPATSFPHLMAKLERLPWSAYIRRGLPSLPVVSTVCTKSKLIHAGAVNQRVLGALYNRGITAMPPPSGPSSIDCNTQMPASRRGSHAYEAPRIFVRLRHNVCTVSIDASGPQLHKRGYRKDISEAPLRETLAAAVLRQVAGHLRPDDGASDGGVQPLLLTHGLWDPMCGSGTIAIEAASQALGLAASVDRKMAFESWPTHPSSAYQSFLEGLTDVGGQEAGLRRRALGSDIKPRSIASAKANADRAGVSHCVDWVEADCLNPALLKSVPEGTVVIANWPYGKRLDLSKAVVRDFEALCRSRPDLHFYAIVPRDLYAGAASTTRGSSRRGKSSAQHETLLTFQNRGIPVRLVRISRLSPSRETRTSPARVGVAES